MGRQRPSRANSGRRGVQGLAQHFGLQGEQVPGADGAPGAAGNDSTSACGFLAGSPNESCGGASWAGTAGALGACAVARASSIAGCRLGFSSATKAGSAGIEASALPARRPAACNMREGTPAASTPRATRAMIQRSFPNLIPHLVLKIKSGRAVTTSLPP